MGIKKDQWYEKNHKREKKSLDEVLKRIANGVFWIVNVRLDKDDSDGWRLVVHLRERK